MLNDLHRSLRQLTKPGDTVICALSGGADSVALLFGCCLLKDKLGITLEAAHFNHNLRGEESRRDAEFVEKFCVQVNDGDVLKIALNGIHSHNHTQFVP